MSDKDHPGSMAYPSKRTLNRFIYKLPLLLWRLGFGSLLSHPARDGKRMMVITTIGRKSKLPRHTMVSNIRYDQKDYAISGWWHRSDWVKNFINDPLVTVQSGGRIYSAYARRVEDINEIRAVAQALFDSGGDSHFSDWLASLGIEENLDELMEKRDLVYFVGFDQVDRKGPAPLRSDLVWVWGILIFLISIIWLFV